MVTKAEEFQAAFELAKEIEYSPQWENGTGYFDYAVRGSTAPRLEPGQMAKCMSNNNRRMVFVGTHIGNVVIFDRYAHGEDGIFVANMPRVLEQLLLLPNNLDTAAMVCLLGVIPSDNIGKRLSRLANEIVDLVVTE
jgi:hypothetical protein